MSEVALNCFGESVTRYEATDDDAGNVEAVLKGLNALGISVPVIRLFGRNQS